MFSLKRLVLFSIVGLFVSGLVFAAHVPTTNAQGEVVTCDSTLVTLLYIAEHDYGFHSMLDVSSLDKGQYAPLFEAMMAMMEDDMMEATEEADMMEDDMMEATDEADMMEGDMAMLTPGNVADENPFCTDLRAELDSFFYNTFTGDMMGSN